MKRWGLLLLILSLFVTLNGCSYFSWGKKYHVDPLYNPEIKVVKKWMRKAGDGAKKTYLKLTPAILDGKIFTTDNKGKITAVDLETGAQRWQVNLKEPLASGPGTGDGMVFVGSMNAEVIALKADNGALVWRKKVSNQVLANPTYGYGQVLIKTIQGELIALDAKTGEEHWTYTENIPRLILRGTSSAKIAYPMVVSGFSDGNVVVLTLNKGKLVWERDIVKPSGFNDLSRMVDIDADPVIDDGVIYVPSYQGNVTAIELATGKIRWQQKLSSHAGLAVSATAVYVSDSLGRVWSLNKTTGQVNWRQNDLDGKVVLTGPALLEGYIVVADHEGFVHWLSEKDGRFVSRQFFSKAGVLASPIVADNSMIIFGKDGSLVSLKPLNSNSG